MENPGSSEYLKGRFGIVFLLSNNLQNIAKIFASKSEPQNVITFSLGDDSKEDEGVVVRSIPHITVYHAKFDMLPYHTVVRVMQIGKRLMQNSLDIQMDDFSFFGGKFVFWHAVKTRDMKNFHDLVLRELSRFAVRGQQSAEKLQELTMGEEENIYKFGNPLVGDLWQPHITIGYFPDGDVNKPSISPAFEGKVRGIAFCEMGEVGNVAKVLLPEML